MPGPRTTLETSDSLRASAALLRDAAERLAATAEAMDRRGVRSIRLLGGTGFAAFCRQQLAPVVADAAKKTEMARPRRR